MEKYMKDKHKNKTIIYYFGNNWESR